MYLGYLCGSRLGRRSLFSRLLGYSLGVLLALHMLARSALRTMTEAGGKM